MFNKIVDLFFSETILPAQRSFLMESDVRIGAPLKEKSSTPRSRKELTSEITGGNKAGIVRGSYRKEPALS